MKTIKDEENCENISPDRISNEKKSEPLNIAIRRYLFNLEKKYNIKCKDLTRVRNFKGRKGEHVADFLVDDIAVIEAKNWDCPGKYDSHGYTISNYNAKTEIIDRFTNYPKHLQRILIIADPVWCEGVKENLLKKGIHIIELGFLVTNDNIIVASEIIEAQMNNLLFPKVTQMTL